MKRIVIGCDHAAPYLKGVVKAHLEGRGFTVIDVGTHTTDSVDYPLYAHAACKKIQNGEADLGILICGTGIGMSLVANKHKGIRAACCSDTFSARLTREHNDANVLCFGQRVVGEGLAVMLVDAFLDAEYAGSGNHLRRVSMISAIEDGSFDA
ncbi:MAG: ribose 5-phosphate isomerase B [Clostridia bacterium]|nr:ribose 5-phosphate isomerase B [Clostridia bacterium]